MDEPNSNSMPNLPSPTASSPVGAPKEKHSRAFSFVSVLFLLALLAAGVMTYLWYNQKVTSDQLHNDVAAAKASQAVLQSQIDKLKQQNAHLGEAVVDKIADGPAVKSDDDMIKDVVTAWYHAHKDSSASKVTITFTKKVGMFARVGYDAQPGNGAGCILKKSDNIWLVLSCG